MQHLKFILPVLLLLSIGCASATGGSLTPNLAGTQWRLESSGPKGAEAPPVFGTNVTIGFQEGGNVSGDSGCNTYGGTYQINDGKIAFGEMTSTLRACADENANQQEREFTQALGSAGKIEQNGDRLTIWYDNDQSVLNFVRATASANPNNGAPPVAPSDGTTETAAFENQEWVLVSFSASGSETPSVPDSRATFLAADGKVQGSTGCNSYSGTYQAQNGKIAFGSFIMTEKACLDAGIMQQEQKFLQALQSAESFEMQSDRFVITYDGGHSQLNFQTAS